MSLPKNGILILKFNDFKNLGISEMEDKPITVFVNKKRCFKPKPYLLDDLDEWKKRYKNSRNKDLFIASGSKYSDKYRQQITRTQGSLNALRKLGTQSKTQLVIFVQTNLDRPDPYVLKDIADIMVRKEVWK